MKIKFIVLSVLCLLLLAGCSDENSSTSSTNTSRSERVTTTTTYKNTSFEAVVDTVDDKGYIILIKSDYLNDTGKDYEGLDEAHLRYDESVDGYDEVFKKGDKIKITVWGEGIKMLESFPPIIYDIKSIQKID